MSKVIPIAIVAAIVGIALAVLIPMWRGTPQMTQQAQIDNAEADIEAARSAVEYGPPAPPAPAQQGVLFDLIGAGKIEANVAGSSIEQVSLSLRNLTAEPIRVQIPAGAFFASNSASAQSMVATSDREIDIDAGQELSISIDTACADLPLDIPDSGNSFTVARAPPQPDLARIAPFLVSESYDVRQAAVWIITDDATFDDLGVLVSGSGYSDFSMRVIDEHDAARAMQIIHASGVNIRSRNIWDDRSMLAESLPEGELRTWLSSQ